MYNIHNFGISNQLLLGVRNSFIDDCKLVHESPPSVRLLLGGDLNFDALGNSGKYNLDFPEFHATNLIALPPVSLGRLLQSVSGLPSLLASSSPTWSAILGDCIELEQDAHTHYNTSSKCTSRIDCLYCYAPAWLFLHQNTHASVLCTQDSLQGEGISDHAPLLASCKAKVARPHVELPISGQIFKDPQFKVDKMMSGVKMDPNHTWEARAPFDRLSVISTCIRKSAIFARDARSIVDPLGRYSRSNFLSANSRAVFRNGLKLLLFG